MGGVQRVSCGPGSPVGGGAEALPIKRPSNNGGGKRRGGGGGGATGVQVVAACGQQGYSSDGDSDEE